MFVTGGKLHLARSFVVPLMLALLLSGCASDHVTIASNSAGAPAPLEQVNRKVFEFNEKLDQSITDPLVTSYVQNVPQDVRTVARNFITNLGEPLHATNHLLQGDIELSAKTTMRFALNSTIGMGGLFDWASTVGLPSLPADFDQTLGRWGLPPGEYLVAPVLGPTTVRKIFGDVAERFVDPLNLIPELDRGSAVAGRAVAGGMTKRIDVHEDLKALREDSFDMYARMKSLYMQKATGAAEPE